MTSTRPDQALVPVGAPKGVVDVDSYERDGVDPMTGLTKLPKPPGAKLDENGKNKVCELIISGLSDVDVAKQIVEQGFVVSYSTEAVRWWRKRPEVLKFLDCRTSQAFQTGLSARGKRLTTLNEITQAMIDANFHRDQNGKLHFDQTDDPKALSGQAAIIDNIRKNVQLIGDLVGDTDPKRVQVAIGGTVTHEVAAARLGMGELSDADLDALLASASTAVGGFRAIQSKETESIDAEFTIPAPVG